MFQQFKNLEFSESVSDPTHALSRQDKRVIFIYKESARLLDGHYEIAIPWKLHPPGLPNNRLLAKHRLKLLRKRLIKDPELYSRYSAVMSDLLDKGYAKCVPEDLRNRDDGKVWYLPHHSVVHPKKLERVYVVFDCAARYPAEIRKSFGGVWSASCPNFKLLRTARDNSSEFHPSVSSTVTRNFYVDDCLKSVKSQDEVIDLVNDLQRLLRRGSFNLTKLICNSRAVLEKIPQSGQAKEVKDLDLSHDVRKGLRSALEHGR
ncbi:uncharacterized protein [Montipora foliosa]|uniref:uncharacterized protein n=1 Tax=Montipora foliosa TaxID=591990 RepID=UPI0035F1AF7F